MAGIQQPTSEEERDKLINERNARTIKVLQLPLNENEDAIRATFGRYGEIENIQYRAVGSFQRANITYREPKSIEIFKTLWGTFIHLSPIKIFAKNLTKEEYDSRNVYRIKLAGMQYAPTI